jgi:putative FmdB family regulatory protein
MPIYEYQCEACGHRLEKLQKISDEPLRHCPACGAPKLTKLVSAAAFRLKGAGWYETDFKTGKKKNVSQTEKSDSSDTSSGSSPSSSSSSSKDSKSKSNSGASSAANN